jgi:hypothetical protein
MAASYAGRRYIATGARWVVGKLRRRPSVTAQDQGGEANKGEE